MSATATAPVDRVSRRPVLTGLPTISVVPTPASTRGLFLTVLTCALLFIGSLAAVFALNTAMVEGAYEVRSLQLTLNDLADEQAALSEVISEKSTAKAITEQAEALGMVPATDIRHIDIASGALTGGGSEAGQ